MSLPESVAQSVWIRKALSFVGTTFLLYDYLLTLDQEITYVWNTPWTKTKVLFLANRYATLLGQIFILVEETGLVAHNSQDFCRRFIIFGILFGIFCVESIHILVILRAWAIWGCTRRMAVTLISVYSVYLFFMIGLAIFVTNSSQFQELQYLETTGICIDAAPHSFSWAIMAVMFAPDIVVFGITMWNLWKQFREYGDLFPSSLVHILIRDALIFYVVSILYNLLFSVMTKLYANDPMFFISISFGAPMLSVAGQRLFLNLRGLTVRTYSRDAVSVEIDRQLAALDEVGPESRRSRARSGGPLELEFLGLEDFKDNVQQEVDMVIARGNGDAEAETHHIGMDAGDVELRVLDGTRRRSRVSQSEGIMEVLRLSGERRA